LEFDLEQHADLKKYCEASGIGYATSVWDITSAKEIASLKPDFIKVPSACNNHFGMMEILRDEYEGEVHISVGMTTHSEEEQIISFFEEKGQAKDRIVMYSCTSGYPVPFEDVNLLEITRLREAYEGRVKEFGFSGHHLGIAIDMAAYSLGGIWVERHFTKDRTWKGTDHAASLEPGGFGKLVRDLNATYEALHEKPSEILPIEQVQRDKLKYRSE
ncbi:MAG: N-acetylneuraminate synthase family protein, partial [Bacteroidota bacterium]